jgi:hypothetical protein
MPEVAAQVVDPSKPEHANNCRDDEETRHDYDSNDQALV